MKRGGSISIWFFIGISLLVNGLLILGAGIWWGGLLAVIGAVYCLYYAPGKGRS